MNAVPPEQRAVVEPEVKGTVPGDLDRIRLQPLHELLPGDLFRLMLLTAPVAGPVVGQLQQIPGGAGPQQHRPGGLGQRQIPAPS